MKKASYDKVEEGGGVNVYKRLCTSVSHILHHWCWSRVGLWHIVECGWHHAVAISQLPTLLHEPRSVTSVGIRWAGQYCHLSGSSRGKSEVSASRNTSASVGCTLDTNLYVVRSIEVEAVNA